jgi:hypothetical protein
MFPREIVDLIIDNLHNNTQALLQLSLVSFTVSDSSRRHLLRSLTIRRENLDLFLLECDFTHGKAARNQCAAIATFRDCTRNLELVCTAGIGTKGCWRFCLQAVGRIPFVLSSMKSLELVDLASQRYRYTSASQFDSSDRTKG